MSRVACRLQSRWNCAHPVARFAIAVTLGSTCFGVAAQARTAPAPVRVVMPGDTAAHLERAFWACDHAAARGAMDSGEAMACSVVVEELKKRRFGGDFGAMHAWWQRSRSAGHRTPDAASRAATRR